MKRWLVVFFVLGLVFGLFQPVFAQGEDSVLIPLLGQLLVPGVLGAAVGLVFSYVVEWLPEFEQQSPRMKRLYFFVTCVVVSTLAGTLIAALNGFWNWDYIVGNAITASLAAMSMGTLAHTRDLSNKPRPTLKKPSVSSSR